MAIKAEGLLRKAIAELPLLMDELVSTGSALSFWG
jgi:hypothetical protein